MLSMRSFRIITFVFIIIGVACCSRGRAQAALLMEEPYGIFGALNPTGHNAIYFERICAETPVKLRRCQPGEMGVVIARYQGIDGYDWVAIPLLPYLYAVENAADVPAHVDRDTVERLRNHYRETHLESLGANLRPGNFCARRLDPTGGRGLRAAHLRLPLPDHARTGRCPHRAVERRPQPAPASIFCSTTAPTSRACSSITIFLEPSTRSIFPDAGMTTPKQITYKLVRYARKHPETQSDGLRDSADSRLSAREPAPRRALTNPWSPPSMPFPLPSSIRILRAACLWITWCAAATISSPGILRSWAPAIFHC